MLQQQHILVAEQDEAIGLLRVASYYLEDAYRLQELQAVPHPTFRQNEERIGEETALAKSESLLQSQIKDIFARGAADRLARVVSEVTPLAHETSRQAVFAEPSFQVDPQGHVSAFCFRPYGTPENHPIRFCFGPQVPSVG